MKAHPLVRIIVVATASALAVVPVAAKQKPPGPPTGEVTLDIADPVIEAVVNGVKLRLRVGLEQKNLIELNPAAANRLGIRFEPDSAIEVGRVELPGIIGAAPVTIDGRPVQAALVSHGRDCCDGVDGGIGAALLPYAIVRFVRRDAVPAADMLSVDATGEEEFGLQVPVRQGRDMVYVQYALDRPETVMTSSAGAILARAHSGRLVGETGETVVAFGIRRPTRMVKFDRAVNLTGFLFDRIAARTTDFAGHQEFPADPINAEDIVVKKKVTQQKAWPVVIIGRDRLDACTEIMLDTQSRRIDLRCGPRAAS